MEFMLDLGPDFLSEEYMQQYTYEFGELKLRKLFAVINTSTKIEDYVNYLIAESKTPNSTEMQRVVNSHSFFYFAKEETVCAACLAIIHIWYSRTFKGYSREEDKIRSQLITNTISHSNQLKYNQTNSFFDRYIFRIAKK